MNPTTSRGKRFPLWRHKGTGLWCKKHKGEFYYFGADKEAALKRDLAEWTDILAGRKPRLPAEAVTVRYLVNTFLTAKRDRVDCGELSAQTWAEYHRAGERIVDTFGRERAVKDLRPADFGKLRAAATKNLGPVALAKFITLVRTVFAFAGPDKPELIDVPVRYADQFNKPPKRVMRLKRHRKGPKLIAAVDVRKLMDASLLYESPFTDITPRGPDGLFTAQQVDDLVAVLRQVEATAMAV